MVGNRATEKGIVGKTDLFRTEESWHPSEKTLQGGSSPSNITEKNPIVRQSPFTIEGKKEATRVVGEVCRKDKDN